MRELAEKGARVVLLAHQGGDLEYHNYASTEPHAAVLSELVDRPGAVHRRRLRAGRPRAVDRALRDGEILLLDNVRFCGEELTLFEKQAQALARRTRPRRSLVRKLAPLADLYVCDAFAAVHRSQPSLVGFEQVLPSAMGRLFEREYTSLSHLREDPARPCVFVLGGAKIQEAFPDDERGAARRRRRHGAHRRPGRSDHAAGRRRRSRRAFDGLTSAQASLEEFVEESQRRSLPRTATRSCCPPTWPSWPADGAARSPSADLPVDELLLDLGHDTVDDLPAAPGAAPARLRQRAAGVFEKPETEYGTQVDLGGDGRVATAYTALGGGDSIAAMNRYELADRFDYVCTAGGGMVQFLSGEAAAGRRGAQGRRCTLCLSADATTPCLANRNRVDAWRMGRPMPQAQKR